MNPFFPSFEILTGKVFGELLFHFQRSFVRFLGLFFCHSLVHFPGYKGNVKISYQVDINLFNTVKILT